MQELFNLEERNSESVQVAMQVKSLIMCINNQELSVNEILQVYKYRLTPKGLALKEALTN